MVKLKFLVSDFLDPNFMKETITYINLCNASYWSKVLH